MQPSALYRRGVVLPLTTEAVEAFRSSEVEEATPVRHLSISDDGAFTLFWQAGIFAEINARCDSLIDDYEDEEVDRAKIPRLIEAVEGVAHRSSDARVLEFCRELLRLGEQAAALDRPLFFIL